MLTLGTAPAACVHNGKVYVIDGWTGSEPPLNKVEVYDPGANSWSTGNPAPTHRWFCAATAMDSWVFVCGGALSFSGNYTNLVEAYSPATGQWSTPVPLPVYAKGLGAGVVRGRSYVVGGFNGIYLADNSEGRLVTTGFEEGRVPRAVPRLSAGPNPCRGVLRLQADAPLDKVEVFDLEGKSVIRYGCTGGPGYLHLDMAGQPDGVYFVTARFAGGRTTAKFVLKR